MTCLNNIIKKIKIGFSYLKVYGPKVFLRKVASKIMGLKSSGQKITPKMKRAWRNRHDFVISPEAFCCDNKIYQEQKKFEFTKNIKFSILVPLYNTPENFLKEMIASVLNQTYQNWELCLADGSDEKHGFVQKICEDIAQKDNRIKYKKLEKNGGISANTNACLEMATGDYISLFDHDDILHPYALFETMNAICQDGADFIYTDEATFKSPNLHNISFVNFKPDFAPDYLNSINYICHFTSFKKNLLKDDNQFDPNCDGAQDYDMILRLTEKASCIKHIPKCLYYWRASSSSTASTSEAKSYTTDAGKLALEKHFDRLGISAQVEKGKVTNTFRIKYPIVGNPLVSILIPNYEHWQILKTCIDSILNLSTYKNFEIIIVENNSKTKETFDYYNSLSNDERIKIVAWEGKFNFSAINNFGFKSCKGDYIILLNNDTQVISKDWIQEMLMFAQRSDVGAVGAMLYYPSDKVQHAGVLLGVTGVANHSHLKWMRGSNGYCSRMETVQNYSAVTAACLMVSKKNYESLNGLDENFEVAFNDVDFCLRIRKAGYLVVWTPFAELYHYESESRGNEDTPEKMKRFYDENQLFFKKWSEFMQNGDPYYNPNLTKKGTDFGIEGEIF